MFDSLYPLIRPLLFKLEPETAHHFTLSTLKRLHSLGWRKNNTNLHSSVCLQQIMGITFPNPIGLAAGLDKDGTYIDTLATLGFGFIEVGTVTPRSQEGNPQPRLFRLPRAKALINRMGFNNHGVETFIANIKNSEFVARGGILGINIGKNANTPIERAYEDYLYCLEKVYSYASYITVNISSPNTKNLRDLQNKSVLNTLLTVLKTRQQQLADKYQRYIPLVIKIAPDLSLEQIKSIAADVMSCKIDGIIATNTTLARHGVSNIKHANESGGLSGFPLLNQANNVIRILRNELGNEFPLIGTGGILSANDALNKRAMGANLIQVYTGLIYQGPKLIKTCIQAFIQNQA